MIDPLNLVFLHLLICSTDIMLLSGKNDFQARCTRHCNDGMFYVTELVISIAAKTYHTRPHGKWEKRSKAKDEKLAINCPSNLPSI